MQKRMDALAEEPAIAARAPGKHGMALMQAAGDSALYLVDDIGLQTLSRLFAETAARAPTAVCASLYTGGSAAFPDAFAEMLRTTDSTLVDRWAAFMTGVTRAGILRPPSGRVATPDVMTEAVRRLLGKHPPAERATLRRGAAKTGSADDVCFFSVTLYRDLASLPASEAGPLFRALMRGVQPKIV